MDMWKWTRLHFYTKNKMFLISNSYMYFHLPDITFIPSECKNWISLYRQWRGSKLLQNIITNVHGIISQRTGILTCTTPNLSPMSGTLVFIPSLFCSSATTFTDFTTCIWPLNSWIKCPNLVSELLSFCGSISFSARPSQQTWTVF
jgi:hypothetical protein